MTLLEGIEHRTQCILAWVRLGAFGIRLLYGKKKKGLTYDSFYLSDREEKN